MTTPAIRPPRELRAIVSLIGDEAALKLVETYGGQRIQVPARATASCALARAVGLTAARALVTEFRGTKLAVPLCKRWRILHLRARGLSYAAIARELTVSEATVHQTLQAHGRTGAQPTLPGL